MRFTVTDFNGRDVRVSLEAEGAAELHQLKWLRQKLRDVGANTSDWCDMEGGSGIALVVEKMPKP